MVLVYIVVIVIAIFQLILLMKIWNMTNDISDIKGKLFAFMSRSAGVERRIEIVIQNSLFRLKQEYLISNETNLSQLPLKLDNAFKKDKWYFEEMLADYDLTNHYSVERLKSDIHNRLKSS
jgi:hypothetical protein